MYEAQRTTGPSRGGELTVAGQRVIVTQAIGCSVAIGPTSQTVTAGGGSGSINVSTAAGCPWSAQSDAEWITITSARSGTGPGSVTFSVGGWDGPRRIGTLRVGPQVFTVTQNSGCRFSISPESFSVASAGGSGGVAVTTVAGCDWTATSNAPWITFADGIRSGNGSVQFNVAATTGPARSGTLTVAGRTFTVSQSSGCSFSISPTAQIVPEPRRPWFRDGQHERRVHLDGGGIGAMGAHHVGPEWHGRREPSASSWTGPPRANRGREC